MISNKLLPVSPDMLQERASQGTTASGGGDGADFLAALLQSKGVPGAEDVTPEMLQAWMRGEQLPDGKPGLTSVVELVREQLGDVVAVPAVPSASADPQQLLNLMLGAGASGDVLPGAEGEAGGGILRGRDALLAQLKQNVEQLSQSAVETVQTGQSASGFRETLANAARPAAEMPTLRLDHPVQQPGFGQAVGEKVVWMANQQVQQAKIHLDPAHLGPLEISVSLKDDHASVSIVAQHGVTREALQADMPRLREMLGENGFSEVDVNVAQDDGQGRPTDGETPSERAGGGDVAAGDVEGASEVEGESSSVHTGRGLVDHYA